MKTKNLKQLLTLIIIMIATVSISKSNSLIGEKTIEISLPSIQCGICVKNIEKALLKVEGVTSTKVDLENKKAFVTYDESKTTLKKIEKAISNAGYAANKRKANKEAYEKLMECCKLPEDR